jgi:hypothetical protein
MAGAVKYGRFACALHAPSRDDPLGLPPSLARLLGRSRAWPFRRSGQTDITFVLHHAFEEQLPFSGLLSFMAGSARRSHDASVFERSGCV